MARVMPSNDKQISEIAKPSSYLNKKGIPSGEAAEYMLELPPGDVIDMQSDSPGLQEEMGMGECEPVLSSFKKYPY